MIRSIERRLREIVLSILDVEAVWLLPQIDPADFAAIVETGARLGTRFVLAVGNDPEPQRKLDNFAHLAESDACRRLRAMLAFMPFGLEAPEPPKCSSESDFASGGHWVW